MKAPKASQPHHHTGAMVNNSSLGFKHSAAGTQSNTLKIQNMRVYNETAAAIA